MVEILLIALFTTLIVAVVVIISNRFSEKKIPLDKKYFFKASILFVIAVAFMYLVNLAMGYV